jgi:hypothetical protein
MYAIAYIRCGVEMGLDRLPRNPSVMALSAIDCKNCT